MKIWLNKTQIFCAKASTTKIIVSRAPRAYCAQIQKNKMHYMFCVTICTVNPTNFTIGISCTFFKELSTINSITRSVYYNKIIRRMLMVHIISITHLLSDCILFVIISHINWQMNILLKKYKSRINVSMNVSIWWK